MLLLAGVNTAPAMECRRNGSRYTQPPHSPYFPRYVSCYVEPPMQPSSGAAAPAPQLSNDIVFACHHCATSFVVDAAAAGLAIQCQSCGKPTRVPKQSAPLVEVNADNAVRISDLQHQLKENASQRTEITGYINQLSIQLHRWQLRLKELNERKAKLEAELSTLTGISPS